MINATTFKFLRLKKKVTLTTEISNSDAINFYNKHATSTFVVKQRNFDDYDVAIVTNLEKEITIGYGGWTTKLLAEYFEEVDGTKAIEKLKEELMLREL